MEAEPAGPLAGLRVVDCSVGAAGIRTTTLFADYGADVLWIEPPGGDPGRVTDPISYAVFCRGKRSITLDLERPEDVQTAVELVSEADVFVENRGPGEAERLGLGFATLHHRFPGLVYCSMSSFGASGRYQDLPQYEALIHAIAGTMGQQVGFRDGPIYENLPFAAIGAAYLTQIGALSALFRRRQDGIGRLVESTLLDGALTYLSMMWGDTDTDDFDEPGLGRGRLVVRAFRCSDEEYLGVHTGAAGAFGRLMNVTGLADRVVPETDGQDVGVPLTDDEFEIIDTELPVIFASETRATWLERLLKADICAIPVLRPGEVFDEPQPVHNEMILEVDDPAFGRIQQVGPSLRFRSSRSVGIEPAPIVGSGERAWKSNDRAQFPVLTGAERGGTLLRGLKVLDFGVWYATAYSSRMLADLGADVIKVEPVVGDQVRGLKRPFWSAHARKRSLAVDLKDPEIRPALQGLLEWADVIHHNMRPGAAERLGIGYEQVREVNPDIVYLYAPGWGSSGPDMSRQSFAALVSGYVGVMYEVAGQFNPPIYPVGNEDPGSGMMGAVGALIALLRGNGEYIENPQLNAAMAHMAHIVRSEDGTVIGADRLDPLQRRIGPFDGLYETADSWICIAAVTDDEIGAMAEVVGVDVVGDSRFSSRQARQANDYELSQLLEDAFLSKSTDAWLTEFASKGLGAVRPVGENSSTFLRDKENKLTGRVAEAADESFGHIRQIDRLVRVSDAAVSPFKAAPKLGEHTTEILRSFGYSPEKITELRKRGVIATTP